MSFNNLTEYTERHLVATSNTSQYEWLTDWQSCDGIDNIRAVLKCKNATGPYFSYMGLIQYAPVRSDNPSSAAALGSAQTNSGEYSTGDISVATNMAANSLFRLGIAYGVFSGGTGIQQGDVSLMASWKSVATNLGRKRLILSADDNGTKYEPLTGWVPATFVSKVKAVFNMSGITGSSANLRYKLVYQTAATSIQLPGAWTDAEGFSTPQGANDERNTGEIALAATTDMWLRLGVGYGLTSVIDNNTTAVLDACCSCR